MFWLPLLPFPHPLSLSQRERECFGFPSFILFPHPLSLSQRERECLGSLSLWERVGVREIHCSYPRKPVLLPKKIRVPAQENSPEYSSFPHSGAPSFPLIGKRRKGEMCGGIACSVQTPKLGVPTWVGWNGVETPNLGVFLILFPSLPLIGKRRKGERCGGIGVLDFRLKACPCRL